MRYRLQNGYTKEKMIDRINSRYVNASNNGYDIFTPECLYDAKFANILELFMPLDLNGMRRLEEVYCDAKEQGLNVKDALIRFVINETKD